MRSDELKNTKEKRASLVERLREVKNAWRRAPGDYVLSALGVILTIAVLIGALFLTLTNKAHGGTETDSIYAVQTVTASEEGAAPPSQCAALPERRLSGDVLLIAAQTEGAVRPRLEAFRESLSSYFGLEVHLVSSGDYDPSGLEGKTGLVFFGNGEFTDSENVKLALSGARSAGIPVGWVGLDGPRFSDALGIGFSTAAMTPNEAASVQTITYNELAIPAGLQDFAPRVPLESPDDDLQVIAWAMGSDESSFPAIVRKGSLVYAGFLPFSGNNSNLTLPAVLDALSGIFGNHDTNPRVFLRLEDISGMAYGPGEETLTRTTEFLLSKDVFMHLGIIPESVNEDQGIPEEHVVADIGYAPEVVRLRYMHPDAVEIVQHGFRHSRRDPRNEGCVESGCASEFFLDDDETMGAEAAAAFALERLLAGKAIIERHLGTPYVYEAPHYVMSPSETDVAERLFPVVLHAPWAHADLSTNFFLPWFSHRGETVYGPSDVGYVAGDDPQSVQQILGRMEEVARVIPDPVVTVFYHPFLTNETRGVFALDELVQGARALGYRFASACGELSSNQ